ncbi:MAG: phosphate ABC transporter substrate-binding protein PstS, partial [Burkholderiaceae bacterium]|nr:phosphate ABC transporter substrate-binding protein PstS [Burkholderiaceae bacterium]
PDDDGFKSAAAGADWGKTFYQILTDKPGNATWPISGATYILMYRVQDKPEHASSTLKFFDWAFATGNEMAAELEYVPLPGVVKSLVRTQWEKISASNGQPVRFK